MRRETSRVSFLAPAPFILAPMDGAASSRTTSPSRMSAGRRGPVRRYLLTNEPSNGDVTRGVFVGYDCRFLSERFASAAPKSLQRREFRPAFEVFTPTPAIALAVRARRPPAPSLSPPATIRGSGTDSSSRPATVARPGRDHQQSSRPASVAPDYRAGRPFGSSAGAP